MSNARLACFFMFYSVFGILDLLKNQIGAGSDTTRTDLQKNYFIPICAGIPLVKAAFTLLISCALALGEVA